MVTSTDSLHKDSLNFQWIPLHIGVEGNEILAKLAKDAAVPNADIDIDLLKSNQKRVGLGWVGVTSG